MSPITRALLILLASASCSGSPRPAATGDTAVPVRLAQVEVRQAAAPIHVSGVIAAKDELALAFKIGGVVRSVAVEAGASVKAGQLLATLDTVEVDARVSQARQALTKAERDLARVTTLHDERALPLQAKQDAETAREVAGETLRAAEFDRRYAIIVAPSEGRVMARHHDSGELVAGGAPIFDFAATGRGWVVRVGLTDRDVVRISEGDTAAVSLGAYPGRAIVGTVRDIAGAAKPRVGTYDVELAVNPGELMLLSGMIARVVIEPRARHELSFVPVEAFRDGNELDGCVYTLDGDDVARRVPVHIAYVDEPRIAIVEGLAGVTRVVTDGAAYLRDGMAVRVVP